ncbi:MAG: D-alanyl-D-alanine carboxypeptidase family protein [Ruminococcaceae bacterium]|nr:D-alanyl-D-alanine carboxypeptidase family protein [Oscillospiraceae bacterium]
MNNNPKRPDMSKNGKTEQPSGNKKRPADNRSLKDTSVSVSTLLCVVAVAALAVSVIVLFSKIITKHPEKVITKDSFVAVNPITAEAEKNIKAIETDMKNNFDKIKVSNEDTKAGNLILVNNDLAYTFDPSPMRVAKAEQVNFSGYTDGNYVVSYPAYETLTTEAMNALNDMTAAFAQETGIRDLYLLDSYRSYEDQERVYEEKGPEIATVPGHSEHHTGLAFDFEIYRNSVIYDFDGTGDYAWVHQNCYKYGYILRYPEDKTQITDISYEPWHFRYVGKEHAYYMYTNKLCLEEYLEMLKGYPPESARLNFTTDSGESYMIYSQAVSGNEAEIYVPKNYPYTLSGGNNGYIIVSCKTN